ncbi:MAG: hypothetical protein QOG27_628 [Verrucomicrobiota bacterium]
MIEKIPLPIHMGKAGRCSFEVTNDAGEGSVTFDPDDI